MKRILIAGFGIVALIFAIGFSLERVGAQYSASNYMEPGGASWKVGGVLDIVTGGALKVAGVDKTAAVAASVATPVSGVAAGYKIARGETALDGSNPTPAATGLTAVIACSSSIKATTAPGAGDGTRVITYDTSGATLNLYAWAPISGTDPTLVASTGTETVGWVCVGT